MAAQRVERLPLAADRRLAEQQDAARTQMSWGLGADPIQKGSPRRARLPCPCRAAGRKLTAGDVRRVGDDQVKALPSHRREQISSPWFDLHAVDVRVESRSQESAARHIDRHNPSRPAEPGFGRQRSAACAQVEHGALRTQALAFKPTGEHPAVADRRKHTGNAYESHHGTCCPKRGTGKP
jgi:hypothetical protein